jgi:predicted DNA-binding transcriptional regulator AlpA
VQLHKIVILRLVIIFARKCSMESILLHSINADEFFERLRSILKEEIKTALQQDQLLTKEGALKMTGISNATFLKAINEGTVKPQLIKGRKKAMYLESEVLKIEKKKNYLLS